MTDTLPPIKSFLPTSLIEWEGKISCAVFLPGCNFRCPFCHASSLVLHHAQLPTIPLQTVLDHLIDNEGWIDGAVVSGGEATLHPGLPRLIAVLREHVPGIKLDSNGTHPEIVAPLVRDGLINFVSMDVKAPLDERYARTTAAPVDLEAIGASIELLCSSGVGHEFRTTVVPGLHDTEAVVGIAKLLGPSETLILQQFAPLNCLDPSYLDIRPYSRDQLRAMAEAASQFLAGCHVRGEGVGAKAEQ